jgi:PAS domain S-box-containing protein
MDSSDKPLGAPRTAEANQSESPLSSGPTRPAPSPSNAFFVIAAGVVASFVAYHIVASYRTELSRWEDRQASVANDRTAVIGNWLRERQSDAEVLATLPSVRTLLGGRAAVNKPLRIEPFMQAELRQILARYASVYGYSGVYLLRPDGKLAAQATGSPPASQQVLSALQAAIERRQTLIDLWGDSPPGSRVGFAAPVFDQPDVVSPSSNRPIGVIVLELNASRTLYPLLAQQLVPTRTGETILVRRVGNEVEFISPLRFQPDAAGFLRRAFEDERGAVRRALEGGPTEGELIDYRGIRVVAATRRVPGTEWGLVRKVDRREALSAFHRTALLEGLMACFLILASAGLARSYRHKTAARILESKVVEQNQLLRLKEYAQEIVDNVPAGLLVLSSDLKVLTVNRSFLVSFGLESGQVVGRRLDEVVRAEGPPYPVSGPGATEAPPRSVLLDLTVPGQTEKRPVRITLTGIAFPEGEGRLLMVLEDQTESERLRSAAETSERRLRDLVQTVDAIVWEADAKTFEFTFVSQQVERILGYRVADWTSSAAFWPDHIYPPDRERVIAACRTNMARLDVYELEYRMVTADTRVIWLRDKVRVLRDSSGAPQQLRGVMLDVTEERRAEDELRRVNRALKTLTQCGQAMAQAPDELSFFKEVCRIAVEVGEYTFAWVGYAEQDERKSIRPVAQAGHEEGYLQFLQVTWGEAEFGGGPAGRATRTGQVAVVRDIQKDPTFAPWRDEAVKRGYASVVGLPLMADGRAFGVLAIYSAESNAFDTEELSLLGDLARHVSAGVALLRTRADRQRMEEERARLSSAVEQAAEAIVVTDTLGSIVYVNPAFERVSGYPRGEVMGQTPRVLKSGKHDQSFYRNLWRTLTRGDVWTGRLINRKKDGTLYEAEAVISPVRDGSGEIANYVAVERDITREKQLEEQVRLSQRLESVGRLAGGVAHDFNNLLTIIIGYCDLILQTMRVEEPHRGHIAEVKKAADRAAALTRQLLAFSRRQVMTPQVVDLNSVVANIQSMVKRLIGEDIQLVTFPAADLGRVLVDPGQVEQVIMNLVVNSRDAMPQGGKITIETGNVHLDESYAGGHFPVKSGPYAMLAVSDTGCGMDAATKAHIFEPFFTTKEQGKGTGLGLAMVYGIVKQSDGYIWVYSEVGRGTTFKIYFPLVDALTAPAQIGKTAAERPRGSETILIVEDEAAVRALVSGVLRSSGYAIITANSGAEALEICGQQPGKIDLLLTDVVMPEMSGPQLAERLAKSYSKMKVLFVSGYSDDAIVHHGVLDSQSAFLQKPFTPEALARKVREVLDSS